MELSLNPFDLNQLILTTNPYDFAKANFYIIGKIFLLSRLGCKQEAEWLWISMMV